MQGLFTDKYFPVSFGEFVGNPEAVDAVKKWALEWEQGKKGKPLLFFGQTGAGKTCLALLVARAMGWQLFELNASDFRTKEIVERLAGSASQSASFSGKPRLVLIDEVDGLQAQDRGGAGAIAKILKESQNPVILTANDIYADQKLAPIRSACHLLQFKKINYLSVAKRLKEICSLEGIEFEEEAVKELAKNSSGDFRAALSDLQSLSFAGKITIEKVRSLGFREREENVFKVLEKMFKAHSVSEVREAKGQSEVSNDLLLRWIEENIPRIFNEGNDTALAFGALSRADVFNGRIFSRQHYGFLKYSSELMTSGVVLSRQHDYHGWLQFQFPSLLRKLSASSALRAQKLALCKKIGEKTHSSAREVMVHDLPFLFMLFESSENAASLSAAFGLEQEEVAFLLGAKPDSARAKKVFEEAKELSEKNISRKAFAQEFFPEEQAVEAKKEEKEAEQQKVKQTKLF